MKTHYRTIVLSDIHLGTSGSKAKEVSNFSSHGGLVHVVPESNPHPQIPLVHSSPSNAAHDHQNVSHK